MMSCMEDQPGETDIRKRRIKILRRRMRISRSHRGHFQTGKERKYQSNLVIMMMTMNET